MSLPLPSIEAYAVPVGSFPPGFNSQHPAMGKPLEGPIYFPQLFIAQVSLQPTADGGSSIYPYHFPPAFITCPHPMYMAPSSMSDSKSGASLKEQ